MGSRKLIPVVAFVFVAVLTLALLWSNNRSHAPEVMQSEECQTNTELNTVDMKVENQIFKTEIAATSWEQQQGLSGRNCLGEGKAMLFPYEKPGNYCFWMKDMQFAIDMVWLDEEKKIITIKSDVQPEDYPETYCPEKQAKYIVEVNTGVAQANNWQAGTQFGF